MSDWDYIKKLGGEGILRRQDVGELKNQRERVLWLMLDGRWHTPEHIIYCAGGREGLRRMRELREIPHVRIERARISGTRDFKYRLVYEPGIQQDLFRQEN